MLRAVELDPLNADRKSFLADLYRNTGRGAEAEQQLKAALPLDPGSLSLIPLSSASISVPAVYRRPFPNWPLSFSSRGNPKSPIPSRQCTENPVSMPPTALLSSKSSPISHTFAITAMSRLSLSPSSMLASETKSGLLRSSKNPTMRVMSNCRAFPHSTTPPWRRSKTIPVSSKSSKDSSAPVGFACRF